MNLLDENIPSEQFELLRLRGIRCRVIGQDIAELSIGDDNIVTVLHRQKRPTLFTRDKDFFKPQLCHPGYCVAWLDAAAEEAALFIRRFLHHRRFRTKADRMGVVARVHHDGVHFWQRNQGAIQHIAWLEA